MTRTWVRPVLVLCMLPLMLFLFACTTTQRQNVAALTLCVGGIAADVVAAVTNTPAIQTVGLFSLVSCEVSEAALGSAPTSDDTELPQREEREESAR
jgi:hypothetical protein